MRVSPNSCAEPNFDTNFLNPTLLPPRTPLFRDVNTTGWTRVMQPLAGQYK